MKQRKTIAVLSLLLALSISLPACGGGAAEPSPSSESEEAPYSEETSDTTSAAELSDEQREALDDWIWYERGDYTSENWYHIASDGTVEMRNSATSAWRPQTGTATAAAMSCSAFRRKMERWNCCSAGTRRPGPFDPFRHDRSKNHLSKKEAIL